MDDADWSSLNAPRHIFDHLHAGNWSIHKHKVTIPACSNTAVCYVWLPLYTVYNAEAVRIGKSKVANGWVHIHLHAFYNASMAGQKQLCMRRKCSAKVRPNSLTRPLP